MESQSKSSQFDLYWVNLDPTVGKEMRKVRPCIVVSPDSMNRALSTVMVVPLTSTIVDWPFRVVIKSTPKVVSSAACDQLRTVAKVRLGKKIGSLSKPEQAAVARILQAIFA